MTLFSAVPDEDAILIFRDVNDVTRSNVIFTNAKCPKKRNNARYILNKKCTNMHENEDADQLCGNSVTYQRLCSRFLNPLDAKRFPKGLPK